MTTARIDVRTYIPLGWIAIPFCRVEFYGEQAIELEKAWRDVEYEKYRKTEASMRDMQAAIDEKQHEIDSLDVEIGAAKIARGLKFWPSREIKELLGKRERTYVECCQMRQSMDKAEEDRFYDAETLYVKAQVFLKDHGFAPTRVESNGLECQTTTEIWTK